MPYTPRDLRTAKRYQQIEAVQILRALGHSQERIAEETHLEAARISKIFRNQDNEIKRYDLARDDQRKQLPEPN